MRFYISTEPEFPKFHLGRPKIAEVHQRFPMTSKDFPTTSEDNRGSRKILDEFKTGLTNCFSAKKIAFHLFVFKRLHSLLSVGREKLVGTREITILDPQARDLCIMRESRAQS